MTARAIAFLAVVIGALVLATPESFAVPTITQELKDFITAAACFFAAMLVLGVMVAVTSAGVRGD